jgi:hypothetical protein
MNKLLCVWGIALVAILGLVGLSLAYPSAAPVPDDEAANLVGGAPSCYDFPPLTCALGRCNLTRYDIGNPNPAGSQFAATTFCGPDTVNCAPCYTFFRSCIVTTTATPPPGP